VSILE
jgi:hypothetical protein